MNCVVGSGVSGARGNPKKKKKIDLDFFLIADWDVTHGLFLRPPMKVPRQ